MRVAVLDLGTNTFNLVVAEKNGERDFQILHNSKLPVKLGEGRINKGEIIPTAFQRGIRAIEDHHKTILQLKVNHIFAFGTSALRSAKNSQLFLQTIKLRTGIQVDIISGDREAELIYFGVRQTYNMQDEKFLILDIGGGSNEFIIADGMKIFWKKSFKLGIARLLELFKPSNPIKKEEIQAIEKYIESEIQELIHVVTKLKVNTLLGASGSFETFAAMIKKEAGGFVSESALKAESLELTLTEFGNLYNTLKNSTLAERAKMPGLEPMRIEMIVLAAVFVNFILDKLNLKRIIQTNFSLKEGALAQYMNTLN